MSADRPLHIDYRLRAAGWKHCPRCYAPMPGDQVAGHMAAQHSGTPGPTAQEKNQRVIAALKAEQDRRGFRSNFSRGW